MTPDQLSEVEVGAVVIISGKLGAKKIRSGMGPRFVLVMDGVELCASNVDQVRVDATTLARMIDAAHGGV